jgi:aminoglycoside/choline kinase family phosphotransferase
MDKRIQLAKLWLEKVIDKPIQSFEVASEDASFRRYFRVTTSSSSYILMDAPPDLEPVEPFINIAHLLRQLDIHAPEVFENNKEQGFLLLEDLGNRTYLPELVHSAGPLYSDAIKALVKLQSGNVDQHNIQLPNYDEKFLKKEMSVFIDWYVTEHLGSSLSDEQVKIWESTQNFLVEACLEQPQVLVHRDYHSRNLMVIGKNSPAVIDFQDMIVGPISYDLASLFKDCYIEWPRAEQHQWLRQYLSLAKSEIPNHVFDMEQLIRWVDLTGLQRHLKVLGVFSRLNYRDNKSQYLDDLPLVEKYIHQVVDLYPELTGFGNLFHSLSKVS